MRIRARTGEAGGGAVPADGTVAEVEQVIRESLHFWQGNTWHAISDGWMCSQIASYTRGTTRASTGAES